MRSYLAKSIHQNYEAKVKKKYFTGEAELYQMIPQAAYENMDGPKNDRGSQNRASKGEL
jgi:hypothetical protein